MRFIGGPKLRLRGYLDSELNLKKHYVSSCFD
jgi:hypothetical protein